MRTHGSLVHLFVFIHWFCVVNPSVMATGINFVFEPVQVTDSPPICPLYAPAKLHFIFFVADRSKVT